MSSKINNLNVLSGHLSTLRNLKTGKISKTDITTFYIIPLLIAICLAYNSVGLSKEIVTILVTAGALFTGLLLNLLILVYDQKGKLPKVNSDDDNWNEIQTRHTVLNELYYNISYSTLLSLLLVPFSVIYLMVKDLNIPITIDALSLPNITINVSMFVISPILVLIGINLVLTIMMVIKRIYILLTTES